MVDQPSTARAEIVDVARAAIKILKVYPSNRIAGHPMASKHCTKKTAEKPPRASLFAMFLSVS